ncbi:peptide chain release factor 2 [Anaerobranca gottschalkii]|uniref:peptide chain release factor 2 n=1 Tax=Anaerobranca gottschalkii TaxID=108328 RepID=UPI0015A6EFB0|nr:peptide chain release factor 2 [Anaerobranca gottschalkii]
MFPELKSKFREMENRLVELGVSLDVEGKKEEILRLEEEMARPDFWEDREKSSQILSKISELKDVVNKFTKLEGILTTGKELLDLLELEEDPQLLRELEESVQGLEKDLENLELSLLLSGKYDGNNAILSLHPGAGGLESYDWAQMLYRMYTRWAEKRGYTVEILDYLPDIEAGLKSVTILVKGKNAFGYLKGEKGVHRLIRISPFDSSGRRHTSFASVDVLPEMEEGEEIKISPDEIKVDTYRASGAGGQHVNKTDSAVRITHLPTGIVVQCQNERSQHSNKAAALKILAAKLAEKQRLEQQKELEKIRGEQKEIGWGSQIRTYVFHPYSLVKDHRTNVEVANAQGVLDGDIDKFIDGYLKSLVVEKNV